jgi:predicted mannosyl-3-phosphoglycerate phosphatase (HAD superfamily)
MIRRTQTVYVTLDPFLLPRGNVLHHFEEFLGRLEEVHFPCIWLSSMNRFQLDEPRRRLGHGDPFIAEGGCGVYLPEDYFHLKWGKTIRLGRYTVIPIAKPQPAAKDALEELSSDLDISIVPLRSLSHRELNQNTGLRGSEAEQFRQRDFDELFFFAGASETEIAEFRAEAKKRGLTLQDLGTFWSLAVGADVGKCVRELGGLYDRSLRYHAMRIGVAVAPASELAEPPKADPRLKPIYAACDRTLLLTERQMYREFGALSAPAAGADGTDDESECEEISEAANADHGESDGNEEQTEAIEVIYTDEPDENKDEAEPSTQPHLRPVKDSFPIHAPDLWEAVLETILEHKPHK